MTTNRNDFLEDQQQFPLTTIARYQVKTKKEILQLKYPRSVTPKHNPFITKSTHQYARAYIHTNTTNIDQPTTTF